MIENVRISDVVPDLHRRVMKVFVLRDRVLAEIVNVEISDIIDRDIEAAEPLHRFTHHDGTATVADETEGTRGTVR